jgi:hypothetical protein
LAVLTLHLLQNALVYITTLMLQRVLGEAAWATQLTVEDLRALTPLLYGHVSPYGHFLLDMQARLDIEPLLALGYPGERTPRAQEHSTARLTRPRRRANARQLALF